MEEIKNKLIEIKKENEYLNRQEEPETNIMDIMKQL